MQYSSFSMRTRASFVNKLTWKRGNMMTYPKLWASARKSYERIAIISKGQTSRPECMSPIRIKRQEMCSRVPNLPRVADSSQAKTATTNAPWALFIFQQFLGPTVTGRIVRNWTEHFTNRVINGNSKLLLWNTLVSLPVTCAVQQSTSTAISWATSGYPEEVPPDGSILCRAKQIQCP